MLESEFLSVVAIPAVVKFFELLNRKDWQSVSKIVLSLLAGGLAGYFELAGLNLGTGLLAGLAASGLVTIAQNTAPKQEQKQTVEVSP